jgi:hypothetical protein
MIIPKKYGGLEFSAYAHSQVVTKLSTRSRLVGVGHGAQLARPGRTAAALRHRGTEEPLPAAPGQGHRVPAFALTSPWAGSDAASIPDSGVVCKGIYQGKEVLGMRVSWDKRYITLAPGVHRVRPGFPPLRPGRPARRQEAHRHHLRAGPLRPSRRRYRPPPFPAERHVHERPDARHRRLHAARFHHRRPEDGRPGLAHADGVPGGRALDLAAVVEHRHGADDGACRRRLRPGAFAVQDGGRQVSKASRRR